MPIIKQIPQEAADRLATVQPEAMRYVSDASNIPMHLLEALMLKPATNHFENVVQKLIEQRTWVLAYEMKFRELEIAAGATGKVELNFPSLQERSERSKHDS